jgi:hypothetical protein
LFVCSPNLPLARTFFVPLKVLLTVPKITLPPVKKAVNQSCGNFTLKVFMSKNLLLTVKTFGKVTR